MTGIDYGGASKSLLLMLKSLMKYSDIEAFVITQFSNAPEIKNEIEKYCKKLTIYNFPHINSNQAYYTNKNIFKKIIYDDYDCFIKMIISLKPDIIHINSTTLSYLLKPLKIMSPKIKIVVQLREIINDPSSDEIASFLVSSIKQFSDFRIAISNNEIVPFGHSMDTIIMPNPIDFNEIEQFYTNNKIISNNEKVKIGMMSAFHYSKGHINFLKALSLIDCKSDIKFEGIILGVTKPKVNLKNVIKKLLAKDYFTKLNNYVKKNRLTTKVKFIEKKYNVFEFLNSLDIYVRPSDAGDPWGRDIIEAMAMRKPIVATGSSEFFVEKGKTGYLVPPKDPKALTEKIIELINDPQKRIKFGDAGYNKIRKMCDIEEYGSSLIKIYKNLLIL